MKRSDRLALAGWAVSLLLVPIAVDTVAIIKGWSTMSRLAGRGAAHSVTGPLVVGAGLGLGYHLAMEAAHAFHDERQRLSAG